MQTIEQCDWKGSVKQPPVALKIKRFCKMETSNEKTHNFWLIKQRVYLVGIWRGNGYVLEMDLLRLRVEQRHWILCKQMWRICAINVTLNLLFSLGIVHITWPRVSYMKTNMAALLIETQIKLFVVIWRYLQQVIFVDITWSNWPVNLNSNALNHVGLYVTCPNDLIYITNMAVMRTAAEHCYGHVTFILCTCRWALGPCP
jgi:hypothetical protein